MAGNELRRRKSDPRQREWRKVTPGQQHVKYEARWQRNQEKIANCCDLIKLKGEPRVGDYGFLGASEYGAKGQESNNWKGKQLQRSVVGNENDV